MPEGAPKIKEPINGYDHLAQPLLDVIPLLDGNREWIFRTERDLRSSISSGDRRWKRGDSSVFDPTKNPSFLNKKFQRNIRNNFRGDAGV